jgi:predicted urease superfamily metal-dependent hydrolase
VNTGPDSGGNDHTSGKEFGEESRYYQEIGETLNRAMTGGADVGRSVASHAYKLMDNVVELGENIRQHAKPMNIVKHYRKPASVKVPVLLPGQRAVLLPH